MKVGKEGIAAAIAALQAFSAGDRGVERATLREPLLRWREALADVVGVRAELDPDPTGNPFDRLRITVLPDAGFAAVDVVHALEAGTPSIRVRTHQIDHGSFVLDPRSLGEGEQNLVTERLHAAIAEARQNRAEGQIAGVQEWKVKRAQALRSWPDAPTMR
jgi:L-seryl-tRNA(Ser) seleniumtransferase